MLAFDGQFSPANYVQGHWLIQVFLFYARFVLGFVGFSLYQRACFINKL
jgi:hypothetical protein